MNPEQPHADYNFILQDKPKPPRQFPFPGGQNSVMRRAILVGGAAIGLILIIVLFMSLLSSGGDKKELFVKVAQQQAEIARVANLGVNSTNVEQNLKNVAINIALTVTSSQTSLVNVLGEHGQKINAKTIAQGMNAETDTKLETAQGAGAYGSTLATIVNQSLLDYQATLQEAYDSTKTEAIKLQLGNTISTVDPLLKQLQPFTNR